MPDLDSPLVLEKQAPQFRKDDRVQASFRHGDGSSEVQAIQILNARGEPVSAVASRPMNPEFTSRRAPIGCPSSMVS